MSNCLIQNKKQDYFPEVTEQMIRLNIDLQDDVSEVPNNDHNYSLNHQIDPYNPGSPPANLSNTNMRIWNSMVGCADSMEKLRGMAQYHALYLKSEAFSILIANDWIRWFRPRKKTRNSISKWCNIFLHVSRGRRYYNCEDACNQLLAFEKAVSATTMRRFITSTDDIILNKLQ